MLSRSDARKRKERKEKLLTVFNTSFNLRGPNVAQIINKHLLLINNHPKLKKLFPKGSVLQLQLVYTAVNALHPSALLTLFHHNRRK